MFGKYFTFSLICGIYTYLYIRVCVYIYTHTCGGRSKERKEKEIEGAEEKLFKGRKEASNRWGRDGRWVRLHV